MDGLGLFAALGLYGFGHLDAIMLAILAMKRPVLLVGRHGSGKSMLATTLGEMLDMLTRIIHIPTTGIDDLVGIPIPIETAKGVMLEMINTAGTSIWEAQIIMLDELNRAAPITVGKFFDIVNKRELLGKPLTELQFIFASINPPRSYSGEEDIVDEFFGLFPLDIAMLDRFFFIVYTPDFNEISYEEQIRIITASASASGNAEQFIAAIEACCHAAEIVEAEIGTMLTNYVVYFAQLLHKANVSLSGRRVNMLRQMLIYVHGANLVLSGNEDFPIEKSTQLAVLNGIPQLAQENPPIAQIMAAHKQAIEIAELGEYAPQIKDLIIQISDPVERLIAASKLDIDVELYSLLITRALSSELPVGKREALAVAIYTTHHQKRDLTVQAYEVLINIAAPLHFPKEMTLKNEQVDVINRVDKLLAKTYTDTPHRALLRNFVLQYMPLWDEVDYVAALEALHTYLIQLEQI